MDNQDFLDKFKLSVENNDVEVGKTYPVYGMITDIFDETPGKVTVEINSSIIAHLNISTEDKVETIKSRAFEPGIFISTITSKNEDNIEMSCHTIVFGKKKDFDA